MQKLGIHRRILLFLVFLLPVAPHAMGPGIPEMTFTEEELYKPLVMFPLPGEKGTQNMATLIKGYLVVPMNVKHVNEGIYTFSLKKTPDNKLESEQAGYGEAQLNETHSINLASRGDGDVYMTVSTNVGVEIWNMTDPTNPERTARVDLPELGGGNYDGLAWWISWQGRYLYIAGVGKGLYIVETTDLTNPELVGRMPNSQLGNFTTSQVFSIGNLLICSTRKEAEGFSTLDIGVPDSPVLLKKISQRTFYAATVNGNRFFTSDAAGYWDISDETNPVLKVIKPGGEEKKKVFPINYSVVQDSVIISTNGTGISVNEIETGVKTEGGKVEIEKADLDFPMPFGNLMFLGNDHSTGSPIIAHRSQPDKQGPIVNMVHPRHESTFQPSSSRIGVTFTDVIAIESLDSTTFRVGKPGGPALAGWYGVNKGVVNFTPDEPLEPETEYEVVIPQGGVTDIVGNPIPQTFKSGFSTGAWEGTVSIHPRSKPHGNSFNGIRILHQEKNLLGRTEK